MEIDVVQVELVTKYKLDISKLNVYGVETAKDIFINQISKSNIEILGLICLDNTNKVINYSNVSMGGIDTVKVDLAQLFKIILLSNSSSIIIAHNHPSGVLKITDNDIEMTKKIGTLCKIFNIKLIDSLILNKDGEILSIREKIGEKNGKNI